MVIDLEPKGAMGGITSSVGSAMEGASEPEGKDEMEAEEGKGEEEGAKEEEEVAEVVLNFLGTPEIL